MYSLLFNMETGLYVRAFCLSPEDTAKTISEETNDEIIIMNSCYGIGYKYSVLRYTESMLLEKYPNAKIKFNSDLGFWIDGDCGYCISKGYHTHLYTALKITIEGV